MTIKVPASGENRKRIAREYARRNYVRFRQRMSEVMPSGLTRYQECVRKNPAITLFNNAKRRAEKANLPFSISLKDVQKLVAPMRCALPVCGAILTIGNRRQHSSSPTLDQVRIGLGYVAGNVAILCHTCNRRKAESTAAYLRALADWIDSHEIDPSMGPPPHQAELNHVHGERPDGTILRC